MTKELVMNVTCPVCAKGLTVTKNVNPCVLASDVRGKIRPVRNIFEYHITSKEIEQFIAHKSAEMVSDVKVEVGARYCEKKRKKEYEPHRSYAYLLIAFSDEAMDRKKDMGWFGKIGDSDENVKLVETLFKSLIMKFRYDIERVNGWIKNYRNLEDLEEALGMNEEFINDLRKYIKPKRVPTADGKSWVLFSADPESVIKDMLTDVTNNQVSGRVQIKDIYPISESVIEFVVYLYPDQIMTKENPHVRQLLEKETKSKK